MLEHLGLVGVSWRQGGSEALAEFALQQERAAAQLQEFALRMQLDELAYIASNYIFLDHTQGWTMSSGAAYTFNPDKDWATRISTDMLFGSGLRTSVVTPNDLSLPNYAVFNASLVQKIPIGLGKSTQVRFDVINLFDNSYQIRDGQGVGVGAPQFGQRRTFLVGLTQKF